MLSWKPVFWGLLATLGIVCLIYAADTNAKPQKQAPVKINAEDLCSGKCVIIGQLGKPYGEIVKIRAIWDGTSNDKAAWPLLRVTHINGKEVAKESPITFISADVRRLQKSKDGYSIRVTRVDPDPKEGTIYEGRVYESGGYDEQPEEVEKIFVASSQHLVFSFRSWLFLID